MSWCNEHDCPDGVCVGLTHGYWKIKPALSAVGDRNENALSAAIARAETAEARVRELEADNQKFVKALEADVNEKSQLHAKIAELAIELAEERTRLDWWIKRSSSVITNGSRGYAVYFGPSPGTPWFKTPREALDYARKERP